MTELPDLAVLELLAGVTDVAVRGSTVTLDSLDADATVRTLVRSGVAFRDLEVTGAAMEDVFVALTAGECLRPTAVR